MEIEHCHDATNYIEKNTFFFTPNVMLSKISGENTVSILAPTAQGLTSAVV